MCGFGSVTIVATLIPVVSEVVTYAASYLSMVTVGLHPNGEGY